MGKISARARRAGGFWQRWLERHVPLLPADVSRLDFADGVGALVATDRREAVSA